MAPELLKDQAAPLIAGGDWLGELTARGWPRSTPREQANVDDPSLVRQIAESILEAGVDILVTNTPAAHGLLRSSAAPAAWRSATHLNRLNLDGARICVQTARSSPEPQRLVFGELGPAAALLMLNEIEELALFEAYRAQATALAQGGVQALICRGFTEIPSLCVAVRAARTTGLPVAGAISLVAGTEHLETATGGALGDMVTGLREAGAEIWGCATSDSPDDLPQAVAALRKLCGGPVWADVFAGLPQLIEESAAYPESPRDFAGRLKPLHDAGASIICGARGATAEHLAALVRACDLRRRSRRKAAP